MIPAYTSLPGDGVPDAIRRDYLGFLADVVRQCGDIGMYERGGAPVVLVNTPALVRAMLIDGSPVLTKGDLQRSAFRTLLGDSLSMSDGERHHRLRRVLVPLFRRHALTRHAGMIIATAQTIVDRWAGEIDLFGELHRLTVHTLGRTLVDEPELWDETSDFWLARERLWRWITGSAGQSHSLVTPVSHEPEPDIASAITTVQATLDHIIQRRGRRADLLGDLLDSGMLGDADVRDQILALLFAGHETSAVSLFWALHLLSRHPAEQDRLEHELDGINPVRAHLPDTAMVIREAMRLYPPAGRQFRVATADMMLGQDDVRAGTAVTVCPYLLHRRPGSFPGPDAFAPSRWATSAEPQTYIPFGAGERICLGRQYALLETQLLLALIVSRFRLTFPQAVRPQLAVTLRPHGNPIVRVERRCDRAP